MAPVARSRRAGLAAQMAAALSPIAQECCIPATHCGSLRRKPAKNPLKIGASDAFCYPERALPGQHATALREQPHHPQNTELTSSHRYGH
jgi:hypothetical protein